MPVTSWNTSTVHVVSGMDVATQEACSAHYDGKGALVITMCCLPVAIIVKPCNCRDSAGGDGDGDDLRRRLGIVGTADPYIVSTDGNPSSSPSPSKWQRLLRAGCQVDQRLSTLAPWRLVLPSSLCTKQAHPLGSPSP